MPKTIISRSVQKTKKLAERLVKKLPGRIFALNGELGSGKTTFARAFLRALGVRGRIQSPTFLIIKPYTLSPASPTTAFHIDCYRIQKPKELTDLGLTEILADRQNIVLIEWADKISSFLPRQTRWLYFAHGEKTNERSIKIGRRFRRLMS